MKFEFFDWINALAKLAGTFAGDWVNAVATLIASFAGAWFAFRYQNRQKTADEVRQNIAAGNRALVTLFQQTSSLKLYQVDIIEPYRESLGRHIQMRPTLPFQEDSLSFDAKSLDFLLSPETVQVILDLILEEARYREALKTINTRSLHHFDIVQPKLVAAGIVEGGNYSDKDFLCALGQHDFLHLQRLTDAVVMHVDRTVESLVSMKERLRAALTRKYPKGKFINFELLENPPKSIFP